MKYRVNTYRSSDMLIEAEGFSILNGILHFFDEDGEFSYVIKDWSAFVALDQEVAKNPDQFYESLNEGDR